MDFSPRESDSDYTLRLQMEEALAASLSSKSRSPQRPSSPPIVATSGLTIAVENDRNESTTKTVDYDFDLRKAVGEGNSKGKGKIHHTVTDGVRGDVQNPNNGHGNIRDIYGSDFRIIPCPVIRSQKTVPPAQLVGEGSSKVNAAAGKFNGNVLFRLYSKVRGKWMAKRKKSSFLSRESILSKVSPHEDPRQAKAARKENCVICYHDIDAERMFSVDKCLHRFCCQCVRQHINVKMLHGMVPKCPHYGCSSELVIDACGKLLTPNLSKLWKQRIKENEIPVTERVYCPYPRCSALMSKTSISESATSLLSVCPSSGVRRCVDCRGLFCVDCKVPWHGTLSCTEYKKLHPNPPTNDVKLKALANNKMWRQCDKCQHMIELTQGCNHITCRCGYEFCYDCGEEWNKKTGSCTKRCPPWKQASIIRQDPARANYYYVDDEEDDDEDYDHNNYDDSNFHVGHSMNAPNPQEPYPIFNMPGGRHMLSPYSTTVNGRANEQDQYFGKYDIKVFVRSYSA